MEDVEICYNELKYSGMVIFVDKKFMFFISHRSNDNEHAKKLYKILKEMNPEWEIFLDCSDKRPLESSVNWYEELMRSVKNSNYLIVIASEAENLKSTYVIDEIEKFRDDFENRQCYFGIFFSEQEFNKVLSFSETFSSYFKFQENLLLNEGETLDDAEERLKSKIVKMMNEADNGNVAEILDKVKKFAIEKEKTDPMFSESAIEEGLIPVFKTGEKYIDFTSLCKSIERTNIAIIGSEGGCGKTTLLTKIFYHYLNNADVSNPRSMIPIYVDAKNLAAENFLVLRWLTKILYDEQDATTSKSTSDNLGRLIKEFSIKTETPRYLLIIDGYNEIPNGMVEKFNKELLDFLPDGRYSNIRLLISGRYIDENIPERAFNYLTIGRLNKQSIESYLASKGQKQIISDSLVNILSIPMYLKIYAETSADDEIKTKADLLCKFVEWQQEKDAKIDEEDSKKKLYNIFLRYALPILAHNMVMSNSTFIFTKSQFARLMPQILDIINGREYKEYFGSDYVGLVRNSGLRNMDEYDLEYDLKEYMVSVCAMLRCDSDGSLTFVHQIYRDFFCAEYISTEIKRSAKSGCNIEAISQKELEHDVIEFTVELLKEKSPFFDEVKGAWDYSCNDSSSIVPVLDVVRKEKNENVAMTVANLVELLKFARFKDLSNLDFSELDLTKSNLRTCYMYRFDKGGKYSTTFAKAKINRDSIFTENHFDKILAACTNEDTIVCIDGKGFIKFWEKKRGTKFPKKILTDMSYSISRMFFSKDSSKIFAMTEHEILEIPVPEDFLSKARPRVVFKTAKRLREMRVSENDEIFFTTNLNPFNFKNISAPDAPDEYNFYGINSAACVNGEGNRLAFGYIAGYECLKLYDYNSEDNVWRERRYGYIELLNNFMVELEETFIKMKLYHKFDTNNEYYDKRRTYFLYLQQQFEDAYVNLAEKPVLIVTRCRGHLVKNGIELREWQNKKLDALAEKYKQLIIEKTKENNLLMMISGRKVTGVDFKEGTNTILLSCTLDFKDKSKNFEKKDKHKGAVDNNRRYKNLVIELNTDTFETRFITRFDGAVPVRASYCGNDILVINERCLTVYDNNGSEISRIVVTQKAMNTFAFAGNGETFFSISSHFVYEMDKNLNCLRSMNNYLGKSIISYNVNADGEEYLAAGRSLTNSPQGEKVKVVSLENGKPYYIDSGDFTTTNSNAIASHGNLKIKICSDKIVTFENEIKKDEVSVPYKLFVCGCDFRGVQGNITENGYINLLNRYGAITDDVVHTEVVDNKDVNGFTPSTVDFVVPEWVDKGKVPYSNSKSLTFEDSCHFSSAAGGNNLYEQKTWMLINNATYSRVGLEATDFSILEWVNRLVYATPDMIKELVEAGLIEKPVGFSDVTKRASKVLHRSFKFLYQSRFSENGIKRNVPIYTVNYPYGEILLEHIIHEDLNNPLGSSLEEEAVFKRTHRRIMEEHLSVLDYGKVKAIRAQMALNQWFTMTARRYKDKINDYSLDLVFDTDNHFNGRARIHCHIILNGQPFFVQEYRMGDQIGNKVERMCIIATHYRSAVRYGKQLDELKRKPVIVIVGENFEHCKELENKVREIYPHVRKIFTYDALICSEEAFEGAGNHFEFVDGVPYSVKLEDVFKTK